MADRPRRRPRRGRLSRRGGRPRRRPGAWSRPTGPTSEPALILQGHVDVVPIGDPDAWTRSLPSRHVRRTGGRARRLRHEGRGGRHPGRGGRGAGAPVEPCPPFAVHFVVGEEDGGLGAFATLARGHTGRCCIIPEPTDLRVVTANAGALTFRIEVPGLATHGSTRYAGSSAIDSYLPIHRALAELETPPQRRRRAGMTRASRSPTRCRSAGSAPVTGPAPSRIWRSSRAASGCGSRRTRPQPGGTGGRRAGRGEHGALPARPSAGGQLARRPVPGGRLPAGHRLGRSGGGAARTGHRLADLPPPHGVPYGSDLRLYAQAGIPTLHYGPGDVRQAHGPDESVPIDQLAHRR